MGGGGGGGKRGLGGGGGRRKHIKVWKWNKYFKRAWNNMMKRVKLRTTCKQNIVILHISSDQDDGQQTFFLFFKPIDHTECGGWGWGVGGEGQ